MTPLVEISTSGQTILWQPHLLTDVVQSRQMDDLTLEPILNPTGVSGAALFKVESHETSVKWAWGQWKRVEIRADQVNGLSAPLNYVQPPRPSVKGNEVKWNELPAASAVELTFYGADEVAGGHVRIEVPDTATFGRDVEFVQPRGGMILVRLLNAEGAAGLSVERLRLWDREEFRLKGDPIAFRSGESHLSVPVSSDFFGIIAVVRNRHQRRSLIGYAHYDGERMILPNLSQSIDATEFQKVRRWIEGDARRSQQQRRHQDMTAEEWFDSWPLNSRKRLRHLSDQARRRFNLMGDEAHKMLRVYPTGLLRYLALAHCGYTSSSAEKMIRLLNESSFQSALNTALPNLGGALAHLKSLEEKIWSVRHADNPNLVDAIAWAGNQGMAALERALHLLDKRSEARAAWEARQVAVSP
jgi:hypothetical protein